MTGVQTCALPISIMKKSYISPEIEIQKFSFEDILAGGETCYTQGQEYLVSFSYDGSVHYTYQAGDITLKKHICLKHGANVCAIAYEIENNGPDASLTLVPLFNFREHSASSRPEDFHFRTSLIDNSLCLIPESHPDTSILFQTSEGIFSDHTPMFDIDIDRKSVV